MKSIKIQSETVKVFIELSKKNGHLKFHKNDKIKSWDLIFFTNHL